MWPLNTSGPILLKRDLKIKVKVILIYSFHWKLGIRDYWNYEIRSKNKYEVKKKKKSHIKKILHMKSVQQKQKLLSYWSQFDFLSDKYVPFKTVNLIISAE